MFYSVRICFKISYRRFFAENEGLEKWLSGAFCMQKNRQSIKSDSDADIFLYQIVMNVGASLNHPLHKTYVIYNLLGQPHFLELPNSKFTLCQIQPIFEIQNLNPVLTTT